MQNGEEMNHDDIKRIGITLEPGTGVRLLCPRCKGGRSGELSFRIQNYGTHIGYNCFRASCDLVPGDISLGGELRVSERSRAKLHVYEGGFSELPEALASSCLGDTGLGWSQLKASGVRFMPDEDRIWLPVINDQGFEIGGIGKAIDKDRKPKAITYNTSDYPWAHWTVYEADWSEEILWVVEDWISATKCSLVNPAVALLGSTMQRGVKELLLSKKLRGVLAFMDGDDAGWKANRRIEHQLQDFLPVRIWPLPHGTDPKDLTVQELRSIKEVIDALLQ